MLIKSTIDLELEAIEYTFCRVNQIENYCCDLFSERPPYGINWLYSTIQLIYWHFNLLLVGEHLHLMIISRLGTVVAAIPCELLSSIGVRRLFVNFSHLNHILWNLLDKLTETWQEASMESLYQDYSFHSDVLTNVSAIGYSCV